jgi:hypothetical protein
MAEVLIGRVDDPPGALDVRGLCRKCLH